MKTKTFGTRTLSYKARNYWNQLPTNIKDIGKMSTFKTKLREYYKQKQK